MGTRARHAHERSSRVEWRRRDRFKRTLSDLITRLNRYLARAGIASRRKSDDLILAGSVRVNGKVVDRPGSGVYPGRDRVQVDGREVGLPESFQYVLLNKRVGTLVTRSDDRGRTTVFDGVDNLRPATVAVGRLDRDTTGGLLLTDDGEIAHGANTKDQ